MIVFPNAKINIGLDIIARRNDGYHNIETLFYPIGWSDILEIVPAKGATTTLTITGRGVNCPPEKNLVMKAYNAINEAIPIPPVDIYLHKTIPDGAGLGGGSSDAAFTLIVLNKLFSLALTDDDLARIAAGIGADCPFFIYNKPMFASGIGTTFERSNVSLADTDILIVKPPVSIPTAKAYAGVTPRRPETPLKDALSQPCECWKNMVKNDFEPSIFADNPTLARIKQQLMDIGAYYAAMSGSGSSIYGLFKSDILSDQNKKLFGECDTFIGRL